MEQNPASEQNVEGNLWEDAWDAFTHPWRFSGCAVRRAFWGSISLRWYKRGVQGNIPAPGMRFFNGRWETHGSEPSVLGLVLKSKTHVS